MPRQHDGQDIYIKQRATILAHLTEAKVQAPELTPSSPHPSIQFTLQIKGQQR